MIDNDNLRIFLVLFSGVFLGYTALPMPKFLADLFENSNVFKFFVLIIVGTISFYPLDTNKFIILCITACSILLTFEFMRQLEGSELI